MKKVLFGICFACLCFSSNAQDLHGLKNIYHGVQVVGNCQLLSFRAFESSYEGAYYKMDHPFGGAVGCAIQPRLGNTRFYLETGSFIGYQSARKTHYYKRNKSEYYAHQVRMKVPVLIDYMIPVTNQFVIYPCFGIALNFAYEDNDEQEGFVVGGSLPHLGLNAMICNRLVVGLSGEYYITTGSFAEMTNVGVKIGYVF